MLGRKGVHLLLAGNPCQDRGCDCLCYNLVVPCIEECPPRSHLCSPGTHAEA
jgi:hypothetical protein